RFAHMLCNALPQLGKTGRRTVMGETLVQGVTRRVDDVGRCVEIRFSNFKMDDVVTLSLQGPRFDQNFEGGLGAETLHTLRESEFAGLSHDAEISIIAALTQLVFLSASQIPNRLCLQNLRLTLPPLQFGALKRRWPFVIVGFVLLLLIAGLALQIDWTWKRKL